MCLRLGRTAFPRMVLGEFAGVRAESIAQGGIQQQLAQPIGERRDIFMRHEKAGFFVAYGITESWSVARHGRCPAGGGFDDADAPAFFGRGQNVYPGAAEKLALGFLGLKFPPGGQTNVLLFGDPNIDSNNSALGWYGAFKKDDKPKKNDKQTTVLLDKGGRA